MTSPQRTSPPSGPRLFDDTHAAPPAGVHIANIDGASRGNPGPAAYAVVLRGPNGAVMAEIAKCIGRKTNNIAEYYGLVAALDYAVTHSIRALRVRSDSELLVRQMQGRYRVKNEDLKPLHEHAKKLVRGLDYFVIEHIMREQNSDADALANVALDGGSVADGRTVVQQRGTAGEPEKPSAPLRIRAKYRGGAFVPANPVAIPEGSDVELEIRPSKKS